MSEPAFAIYHLVGDLYYPAGGPYESHEEARAAIKQHFKMNGERSDQPRWQDQPGLVYTEFKGEGDSSIVQISPDQGRATTMAVATYKIIKVHFVDQPSE